MDTPKEPPITRPRILIADDHARVLESAVGLLERDFDVVGAVADGRQAVDQAARLDPDAVVLDVSMPELDGFQAARELGRRGLRAKVVFLTMHRSEEHVTAAIEAGGLGYVLKPRMNPDLPIAVHHALANRMVVPSLESLAAVVHGRGHAVLLHDSERSYFAAAAGYIAQALKRGEAVAFVVSESTRNGVARGLEAHGCDVTGAARAGRFVVSDAAEALSRILRNGSPDRDGLAEWAHSLDLIRLTAEGPQPRLTVVGETASLLYRNGHIDAAIEMEQSWNELAPSLGFLTVCCHSMDGFDQGAQPDLFHDVCAAHSAVSYASSTA